VSRESRGTVRGRTHEIQRLVGRSLRAVTNLTALGQRTVTLDCDVIEADGGTRTASVTGAFVALYDALAALVRAGELAVHPLTDLVAATSVGIVDDAVLLDLCYEEDARAEVDMNLVMTRAGLLIEVQGTAERAPFTPARLTEMLRVGRSGIEAAIHAQEAALGIARGAEIGAVAHGAHGAAAAAGVAPAPSRGRTAGVQRSGAARKR
jgi:ribonuclease PH